jgi:2-polyprenyl-3-methyl-5-hydroxy-6-metoxy-1,4-benzoquinol methylase
MSSCCTPGESCSATNSFFSRWSRMYARRFRTAGLEPVQKYLVEGIRHHSIEGRSILDIGCGVGSIHLTLLRQGASRSVGIDMSEGMLQEARHFADKFGLTERAHYVMGDFTKLSPSVEESDIIVLDKVVCCYEDVAALIHTSTDKTRQTYALSHPKENLLMKGLFKGHTLLAKIFGWSFHPFWHNWAAMKSLILSRGFRLVYENSTISWQVLVFERT